jgi:MFS family permease
VSSPFEAEASSIQLGLRENIAQFGLLVAVNAFVGAMVGLERSILPPIAEAEYQLTGHTAMLSFIAVFGITKALSNYLAGRFADVIGRRQLLLVGWAVGAPVPFLLMWAPSWAWVLAANALLGVSQGFAWSMTVIMKIDLVGPKHRGLAMGLNECAGYVALAASAYTTAWIASRFGLRPQPFYLGVAFVVGGLGLSMLVRETREHSILESKGHHAIRAVQPSEVFWRTTVRDRNLSSVTQAGLVNNLNDGMAWGLFPLLFAAMGMDLSTIGLLTAIYPATWGVGQLVTGGLSDRVGRKWLIVLGMWIQAIGITVVTVSVALAGFAGGAVLLGVGTAMVYPTLLAAIGDAAHPDWRATAVGVYRLWRDVGYVAGALVAGVAADAFGLPIAMQIVAALTCLSGVFVAVRMSETRPIAHAMRNTRTAQ